MPRVPTCVRCRRGVASGGILLPDSGWEHLRCLRARVLARHVAAADPPREVSIEQKEEGKGRTFRALVLASVEADSLWAGGQTQTEDERPAWLVLAASEGEDRPFLANLRAGRRALFPSQRHRGAKGVECLRAAGYQWSAQRGPDGVAWTGVLPDLLRADPGMVDPAGVAFVVLPPAEWVLAQSFPDEAVVVDHGLRWLARTGVDPAEFGREHLAAIVPLAYLFAVFLDRRTRVPILADGRFYVQLLLAALHSGAAGLHCESYGCSGKFGRHPRIGFRERSTGAVGLAPGVAFRASHEDVEELLAGQVREFFEHAEVAR